MRKVMAFFVLFLCFCLSLPQAYAANTPLWSTDFKEAVKWTQVTQSGILLVGTNSSLSGIDPDNGKVLWSREDIKKTASFNTREAIGTPILIVNDYSGLGNSTKIYAINQTDGSDLWKTEPQSGVPIGVYPFVKQNVVVLFFSGWNKEEGNGVHIQAFELSSGKKLWDSIFTGVLGGPVLHVVDDSGMFYAKADLSGQQEPVAIGDNLYIPFLGLDCIDLKTGTKKWSVPFKTAIPLYKKAYAPLVVEGDVIYASGYGVVYAIDKNTGEVKWKTDKISSGQIAETTIADGMILARVGGFFYEPGSKSFILDKPLQVVAYDKANGAKLWELRQIELGITNLLYIPESKTVVLADGKGIIGLDAQSTGKVQEKFRVPLKFTRDIGAAEWTSAGIKTVTGGIGGLLNAGITMAKNKKTRMDIPVSVSLNDDGTVAVRGKQHVMSFDPKNQDIKWSNYFAAPGKGLFEVVAMTVLTATATLAYQGAAAGGSMSADSASDGIKQSWGRFDSMANKRFEASKGSVQNAYILTNVSEGSQKGLGVVQVNLQTGDADKQFLFNDKQPMYSVDEVEGKLFFAKGKTKLEAYSLK